jgi:uncharacterized protein (DUF924 family)
MSSTNEILTFWFHNLADGDLIKKNSPPVSLWFNGGRRFDEEIRQKFLDDYQKAKAGELKDWEATVRGRLALVIIFDQFPRNMFRSTPQAFETDPLALELAQRTIQEGKDKELMFVERVFLYMPLMHAESLEGQEEGVRQYQALVEESRAKGSPNTFYFEYNLKYAITHRDIIAKFGRFPHRSAVLGRAISDQEEAFLKSPGSSF